MLNTPNHLPKCLTSSHDAGTLNKCDGDYASCVNGTGGTYFILGHGRKPNCSLGRPYLSCYVSNMYSTAFGNKTIYGKWCSLNTAIFDGQCQTLSWNGIDATLCYCKDRDGCNAPVNSAQDRLRPVLMTCALIVLKGLLF